MTHLHRNNQLLEPQILNNVATNINNICGNVVCVYDNIIRLHIFRTKISFIYFFMIE